MHLPPLARSAAPTLVRLLSTWRVSTVSCGAVTLAESQLPAADADDDDGSGLPPPALVSMVMQQHPRFSRLSVSLHESTAGHCPWTAECCGHLPLCTQLRELRFANHGDVKSFAMIITLLPQLPQLESCTLRVEGPRMHLFVTGLRITCPLRELTLHNLLIHFAEGAPPELRALRLIDVGPPHTVVHAAEQLLRQCPLLELVAIVPALPGADIAALARAYSRVVFRNGMG